MKSVLLSFCLIAGCRFRAHHAKSYSCGKLEADDRGCGDSLIAQLYFIDGNSGCSSGSA